MKGRGTTVPSRNFFTIYIRGDNRFLWVMRMHKKGYAVVAIALLLAGLLPAVGLVAPPQPIMEPVEEVHSYGYATTAENPAAANITRLQISPSHKHVRLQPGEEEEFKVNVRPQVIIPPYTVSISPKRTGLQ